MNVHNIIMPLSTKIKAFDKKLDVVVCCCCDDFWEEEKGYDGA